jgi:hypothetical protein
MMEGLNAASPASVRHRRKNWKRVLIGREPKSTRHLPIEHVHLVVVVSGHKIITC